MTEQDQHSTAEDPSFVDPADGDFRLTEDSPGRRAGLTDAADDAPIDLGAYRTGEETIGIRSKRPQ